MQSLITKNINCPHCGNTFEIELDLTNGSQDFYTDYTFCCNSIHISCNVDEIHRTVEVIVDSDDEQIY